MAGVIRGEYLRRILAFALAAVVAVAVFFLRRTEVLQGIPALVFTVVLVLSLPLSRVFSRRILLAGAIFLGWIPILWWVRLPVPQVDRVGIVLAILSGGLVCWVLWGADLRSRARRLVPQMAWVDAMPVAAGGLATWTMWPLFNIPGATQLLRLLSDGAGWDHCAHSAMVLMIRAKGVIQPMMGASPDGSDWMWSWYSQHPHTAAASLIDLHAGTSVGSIATEIIRYGHGVALMVVLVAVLLAAGVAQLPGLRRRPLIAWPVGAMTIAVFLFGLGSLSLNRAWWNWLVTCAGVGLASLLAASMSGEWKPLKVFALGGLVVATVHGWLLLAPIALVAAGAALVPFGRDRWPQTRSGRVKIIAALVVAAAASLAVIPMVMAAGGAGFLTGGPAQLDMLAGKFTRLTSVLLTGGLALAVGLAAYVRSRSRESALRGVGIAAVPAVGFLLLGLLGLYQLVVMGTVSYYFDKLVMGASLICVPVLAAGVDANLGASASPVRGRLRKSAALVASVLAAVAALQLFGLSGLDYRLRAQELLSAPQPVGERILRASELAASRPFGTSVYLAAMPDDPRAGLNYYYQLSLSLMWTKGAGELTSILNAADESDGNKYDGLDVEGAAQAAIKLLGGDSGLSVIVAPEVADQVRELLPADLRSRVIAWEMP